MSIKLERITVDEGGDFTYNGRREANFQIRPSLGMVDLGTSYLVKHETIGDLNGKLLPCMLGKALNSAPVGRRQLVDEGPVSNIYRTQWTSDRMGLISEKRYVNMIEANLQHLTMTREEQRAAITFGYPGKNQLSGMPFADDWDTFNGLEHPDVAVPFRTPYFHPKYIVDLGGSTTDLSEYLVPEIRVPLTYLNDLATCNANRQFPLFAFGNQSLLVEFEGRSSQAEVGPLPTNFEFQNLAAPSNQITLTTSYNTNESLNHQPIYCGAPLSITSSSGTTTHQVTAMTHSVTTGLITYTLDSNCPAGNNLVGNYDLSGTNIAWTIEDLDLEMHKLVYADAVLAKVQANLKNLVIEYTESLVSSNSVNQNDTVDKTQDVRPNCLGLAVLTPQLSLANAPNALNRRALISGLDQATSYRFTIDGDAEMAQAVNVGLASSQPVQLHYYKLQKWLGAIGRQLKKFPGPLVSYADAANTKFDEHNQLTHDIYPLVTPLVPVSQNIGINIVATGDMTAKTIHWLQYYKRQISGLTSMRPQIS